MRVLLTERADRSSGDLVAAVDPSIEVVVMGDDGLLRQWPRPALDVHKHYGYAFQWFALCALMTGLYVWFQLVLPRRQARRA